MEIEITLNTEYLTKLVCKDLESQGYTVDPKNVKFNATKIYEDRPCGGSQAAFSDCKVKVRRG
jgi:hypothetical protein